MIVPVFDPFQSAAKGMAPDAPPVSPGSVPFVKWAYTRLDGIGSVFSFGTMEAAVIRELQAQGLPYMIIPFELDGFDYYVDLAALTVLPKPDNPAFVDGLILRNIPVGSTVTSEGNSYFVDEGEAELDFDVPGAYAVRLESPQHKNVTLEVFKP